MVHLNIANYLGTPNAILQKFGLQVYHEAQKVISDGETIELYFGDLRNATTGFFHASVGNLAKEFGGKFNEKVKITGLEKGNDWLEKYDDSIALATNPHMADEIDKAIAELFVS